MDWKESIASSNLKTAREYEEYSKQWRIDAMKLENARYGRQFSADEERALLAFRQAPLPISISTAIADTADAFMLSSKPTIKTTPILHPYDDVKNQTSKTVAGLYNYLIQKSWYDSLGSLQLDRVVRDHTNVGHGLQYIVPRQEFGEFSVDIKHLSWRYFLPDPSSVDPLYRDMDAMIYFMRISEKAAYKFVKSIEPSITFEQFKEDYVEGSDMNIGNSEEDQKYGFRRKANENSVAFCQLLTIEDNKSWIVYPKSETVNKDGSEVGYRTYTEMTPELDTAIKNGSVRAEQKSRLSLVEYTSVGKLGYKKVYPISEYNIVPLVYDHRDTPFPYGRMWYLYPLQRALNKFMMSAILNMSILNSTRILAEKNSILNIKEWTQNASMPGAVLEYSLPIPGVSTPPQIVEAKPMSEAWLVMPRWITQMMEYISGMYPTMQGNPEGSPDVFSTVASLQSAGGLKVKRRMAAADATLSIVGRITGEFYKNYAPLNGFTSAIIPGSEDEQAVMYNQIEIKDDTDESGKPVKKVGIKPETDLSLGFKDVRFVSESSNGYESATQAALLTNLATQLKVPGLVPLILENLNIPGADKAMAKADQTAQVMAQNGQMQQTIKELESRTQIFQNQIFQLAKTVEVEKVKGNLKALVEKAQSNPEMFLNQLNQMTGENLQQAGIQTPTNEQQNAGQM